MKVNNERALEALKKMLQHVDMKQLNEKYDIGGRTQLQEPP